MKQTLIIMAVYIGMLFLLVIDFGASETYRPGGENPSACAPCGAPCPNTVSPK